MYSCFLYKDMERFLKIIGLNFSRDFKELSVHIFTSSNILMKSIFLISWFSTNLSNVIKLSVNDFAGLHDIYEFHHY